MTLFENMRFAGLYYWITGTNIGWEVPGIFDVEMQVRNLSLKVK